MPESIAPTLRDKRDGSLSCRHRLTRRSRGSIGNSRGGLEQMCRGTVRRRRRSSRTPRRGWHAGADALPWHDFLCSRRYRRYGRAPAPG